MCDYSLYVKELLGLTRWCKWNYILPPSSLQGADAGLLPSIDALPASRVLRGVQWVTGVARVSGRRQRRAVTQLSLGGIHDGHHPVPGGNQLFLHVVLFSRHRNQQLQWRDDCSDPKGAQGRGASVASRPHLQADCVVVGELHGGRVLRVDEMVVLGDETHEVGDLPDDDAVRPRQTAGGGQVAAGVAGLQGGRCGSGAGADGTGATQVGGIDVYETCGARWEKNNIQYIVLIYIYRIHKTPSNKWI